MSIDDCTLVSSGLRLILGLSQHNLDSDTIRISDIPKDVRTALKVMGVVDPATKAFVCCPKCCACYPFDPDDLESYPAECSNQDTPESAICGRTLRTTRNRKDGPKDNLPVRLFLYHDMMDWLATMFCRPGMEQYLDREVPDEERQSVGDIWEAPILREFLGHDGKPFLKRPGNEARLVFSLNQDGFNPYGNKQAGKKVSVGAMYMACLNLPRAIRHEVENIYLVGIMPGPHEPSLHQINHFLRPLVDDLIRLWNDGIYLTSTLCHPHGRCVRGAVIPLVCDLPAAKQMSGHASHSNHNFCSFCLLQREDMDNLDYHSWKSRSWAEHLDIAKQWRDAQSEKARADLYVKHGVRWSELLRLPYWDPTKFTVVDSMHAFFLGLFKRHCREVWGMNIQFADGDGLSIALGNKTPTESEMMQAHDLFKTGSSKKLRRLKVEVLRQLCRETQTLHFRGTKERMAKDLEAYDHPRF